MTQYFGLDQAQKNAKKGMKEAEGVKSEVGFELGRFELTSKSVQTFPKSYAGRIRDGSTFAYKSKD